MIGLKQGVLNRILPVFMCKTPFSAFRGYKRKFIIIERGEKSMKFQVKTIGKIIITSVLMLSLTISISTPAFASSLDEIITNGYIEENQTEQQVESSMDNVIEEGYIESTQSEQVIEENTSSQEEVIAEEVIAEEVTEENLPTTSDAFINSLKDASRLDTNTEGVEQVNGWIKTIAAYIVRILSYFLVAFLVVRVVLDMVYIGIPFTRSFFSNGYQAQPQQPMGQMQGGMGAPMGQMQKQGGMSGSTMGMNPMTAQSQMGASPALGRTQWISTAALQAVANESQPGPDGRPQSAYKLYAKDMIIVLVVTPILLTLAITGVLNNLGFLIGEAIEKMIISIGNMI